MQNGIFIMMDGVAGSGKTTVIRSMYEWMQSSFVCFRLEDWKNSELPSEKDIIESDVLFTYEPTRNWVGGALRYEMFHDKSYSGISHAHAFALDRELLYRRIIIPALQSGKMIIQDRGISTSLVYQTLMENGLSISDIQLLPGNQLALEYIPDHLILIDCPIETVISRIRSRIDESKGQYADVEFLKKVDARFREQWFLDIFRSRKTKIHSFSTQGTLEETKKSAIRLLYSILESSHT